MISLTVNTSRVRAAMARARLDADRIRFEAGKAVVGEFVRRAVLYGPKDTNRYVRAWAQAGRDVGVKGPIPPLKTSNYAPWHRERLEAQVKKWEGILKAAQENNDFWLGAARRQTKTGLRGKQKTLASKADKAEKTAEKWFNRAREELALWHAAEAAGQAPLIIYGNTTGRGGKNAGVRRKLGITVRAKVYGGEGTLENRKGRLLVVLRNKEAHVRIVEKRHRVVATQLPRAKAFGVVVARRLYVQSLQRAMGKKGA